MFNNAIHNKDSVVQWGKDYGIKGVDGTGPWCFVSWTPRTELVLKPDANLPDEAFKRGALPTLERLGEIAAFFDNEPANTNLAKAMFPDANVILLETQRVPYAPPLAEDVEVVADFRVG